jgi:hypothetical protein
MHSSGGSLDPRQSWIPFCSSRELELETTSTALRTSPDYRGGGPRDRLDFAYGGGRERKVSPARNGEMVGKGRIEDTSGYKSDALN